MLKFVLSNFDQTYVTYDLDSHQESKAALSRLALKELLHFYPIGISETGKDCIEGLLPERVLNSVNGRETKLVMALGSADRREAKQKLKKLYFKEFIQHSDYTKKELEGFGKLIKAINIRFR